MATWDFRSQDPGEVQDFLGGIYAENEFKIIPRRGRQPRTRIYGVDVGEVAQYHTSYAAPFTFVSERQRDNYLIVSCTAGEAQWQRGNDSVDLQPGVTALVSASKELRVQGGEVLAHISTHIDAGTVNSTCARMIGGAIDEPVLFDHVPFTAELKRLWDPVVKSLSFLLDTQNPAGAAVTALVQYSTTLLLEHHPHNYSSKIRRPAVANLTDIGKAIRYIEQNAHRALGIDEVAASMGCDIQALHQGFCRHLGVTPRAYVHLVTLQLRGQTTRNADLSPLAVPCVSDRHSEERSPNNCLGPTEIFLRHLCTLGRAGKHSRDRSPGALTPAKVNLLRHHINTSLGKRLTVEKLASLVCMSPQSFAPAFKKAFKATPAQYILLERLRWARWLLENTDTPISTIAADAGFSSQSHFTSTLKQRLGTTPHELRVALHS